MSWRSIVNRAVQIGVREGMKYLRQSQSRRSQDGADGSRGADRRPGPRPQGQGPTGNARTTSARDDRPGTGYPGDYRGPVTVVYSPDLDGDADPGEVVWGWIPFEEDHTKGKDRPSLVIGKDGAWVLVLMLTSKDHIPGGIGEVRTDGSARWMNIGSGAWDSQGRPSEVRLDRIIRLDPRSIRREGAVMDRSVFDLVAAEFS